MRCRFCTSVLESDAGQWGLGHSLFSVGHSVPPVFGACTSVAAAIYNIMIGEFRSYGARPSFQSAHGSLHHIGGSPRVQHDYIYISCIFNLSAVPRLFSMAVWRLPACYMHLCLAVSSCVGGFPPVMNVCLAVSSCWRFPAFSHVFFRWRHVAFSCLCLFASDKRELQCSGGRARCAQRWRVTTQGSSMANAWRPRSH